MTWSSIGKERWTCIRSPMREVVRNRTQVCLHPLRHCVTPSQLATGNLTPKGEAGFDLAPTQGELVAERQSERA